MSVLIKGMKMPDHCWECPLMRNLVCGWDGKIIPATKKKQDLCPLVEIPEKHGRLIDADALADDLEYDANHFEEDHEMKLNCASWLRSSATPTVIEAEDEG